MKKLLLSLLAFSPLLIAAQTIKIGDFTQGGIVIRLDKSGEHGLVVARHDQTEVGNWTEAKTRCESYFWIHDGQMVRGWRLPTKEELNLIREKRDSISKIAIENGGAAFDDSVGAYYWSGTEEDNDQAWMQGFGFNLPKLVYKSSTFMRSRAVRAF